MTQNLSKNSMVCENVTWFSMKLLGPRLRVMGSCQDLIYPLSRFRFMSTFLMVSYLTVAVYLSIVRIKVNFPYNLYKSYVA